MKRFVPESVWLSVITFVPWSITNTHKLLSLKPVFCQSSCCSSLHVIPLLICSLLCFTALSFCQTHQRNSSRLWQMTSHVSIVKLVLCGWKIFQNNGGKFHLIELFYRIPEAMDRSHKAQSPCLELITNFTHKHLVQSASMTQQADEFIFWCQGALLYMQLRDLMLMEGKKNALNGFSEFNRSDAAWCWTGYLPIMELRGINRWSHNCWEVINYISVNMQRSFSLSYKWST